MATAWTPVRLTSVPESADALSMQIYCTAVLPKKLHRIQEHLAPHLGNFHKC